MPNGSATSLRCFVLSLLAYADVPVRFWVVHIDDMEEFPFLESHSFPALVVESSTHT
jgi:hypothetical protein